MPDLPEHLEPLTDLIDYLDHVALGVHDLRAAARRFQLLGGTFITGADNARQGFRWIHYRLPGGPRSKPSPPSRTIASSGGSSGREARACTTSPSRCRR